MEDPAVIAQSEHAPTPPDAPEGAAAPARHAFSSSAMLVIDLSLLWFIYKLLDFIVHQREDYTFGSFVAAIRSGPDAYFDESFLFIAPIVFVVSFFSEYQAGRQALKNGAYQNHKKLHDIKRYASFCCMAGALLTIISFLLMAQAAVAFSALHFLFHWMVLASVGGLMIILCFVVMIPRFKKDFRGVTEKPHRAEKVL